jgi:hypothetical protein
MHDALQLTVEMNEWTWNLFKKAIEDLTPEESGWRQVPHANTINDILRHLRVEAQWHLMSLEHNKHVSVDQLASSLPLDFERNTKELDDLYTRFIAALRKTTLAALQHQTVLAYSVPGGPSYPSNLLSFHQAVHLAIHLGQIRSIRNLYRKTRGEPARFFPNNPTFPAGAS